MVGPKLARAYGTLAGFGFIGVALLTLPSTRLLEPLPAPEAYLLTLAGLVTGLVCIAIPWDWIDPRWLHVIGVVATAEAAATVAVFGQPYVAFFFLIAVLVAYVAPDARTIGLQLGMICAALFGPVIYGPDDARSALNVALVVAPVILLTSGLFSYLRLKMVHDRRAYHRFAEQTLVLSSQIAGRQLGPSGRLAEAEPVPQISYARPPVALVAGIAVVLGLPLFAGGLAAAGVRLPELAREPFESVGIELPNQEADPAPATEVVGRGESGRAARGGGDSGGGSATGAPEPAAAQLDPSAVDRTEGGGPAAEPANIPPPALPPPTGDGEPAPEPAQPPAGGPLESPLDDLLDDATQGLQGILEQLQSR